MGKTNLQSDAYKFRTPSLRNVALTAPYGHNGAMATLQSMIRHHADPTASAIAWTPDMAMLPDVPWLQATDFSIREDRAEMDRQFAAMTAHPVTLSENEINDLEAFLNSLTGTTALIRPMGRPRTVPSGLPVDTLAD